MSLRHAALIALILAAAILVVGLIYARPVATASYGYGNFSFDSVEEITISLRRRSDGDIEEYMETISEKDEGFDELIELFDGRGFGRTVSSIFSPKDSAGAEREHRWRIYFSCPSGSLTVLSVDGTLFLSGEDEYEVTTNDKSELDGRVLQLLLELLAPEDKDDTV